MHSRHFIAVGAVTLALLSCSTPTEPEPLTLGRYHLVAVDTQRLPVPFAFPAFAPCLISIDTGYTYIEETGTFGLAFDGPDTCTPLPGARYGFGASGTALVTSDSIIFGISLPDSTPNPDYFVGHRTHTNQLSIVLPAYPGRRFIFSRD